jgi:hypothetical protein
MKGKMFTNQKEINRAIRATVNQFKRFLKYKRKKNGKEVKN